MRYAQGYIVFRVKYGFRSGLPVPRAYVLSIVPEDQCLRNEGRRGLFNLKSSNGLKRVIIVIFWKGMFCASLEGRTKSFGWKLWGSRFKLIGKTSDDWSHPETIGQSGRSGGSQCPNAANWVCMTTSLRFCRKHCCVRWIWIYLLGTVLGTGSKRRTEQCPATLVRETDNKHIMPDGDKYYKEK